MAYYPQNATGLNYISYPAGPTVASTVLTANASANTKGTYVEVIAASPFTSNAVHVTVGDVVAASRRYLFDVATGAGGAEVVVVPDVTAEGTSASSSIYGHGLYNLPLAIASGTRIAMRCQCTTGASAISVNITLVAAGGVTGVSTVTNYGADTTDSGGQQIDPGGTANVKGSYSQISASTSAVVQWLLLILTYGHATVATCGWFVDLATGAGGAEVVLIPDLVLTSATSAGATPSLQPRAYSFLTYIAAATRIAVRASCSINTATSRLIDAELLAVTAPAESSTQVFNTVSVNIVKPGGHASY